MPSKNKVNLLGNLGRDPELRYMPNGKPVTVISLATSEFWKNEQGERQERTEWHRVAFFGGLAEVVCKYLAKGSTIDVEGHLRTNRWTDSDNVDRYTTEIRARELVMLGGTRKDGAPEGRIPVGETGEGLDDDIPF